MHPDTFLVEPPAPSLGAGAVQIRWLGTAGYELRCGEHVVLIDPYLTRVDLKTFLLHPVAPDTARIDREINRADAIFVGHSHFDHVLDVPYIARRTGARVYGSTSTANLMAAAGLPSEQIEACGERRIVDVGPFKITLVPSLHSKLVFGSSVPYPGEIPCSCELPIRGRHYRCGDVFSFAVEVSGRCIYHVGTANLLDDEIRHRDVDLLLVCAAGRHSTERFMERALSRLRPRAVMPMHYDNLFRPFDAEMRMLPLIRFGRLTDDIWAFDRDISVQTLRLGGRTVLA